MGLSSGATGKSVLFSYIFAQYSPENATVSGYTSRAGLSPSTLFHSVGSITDAQQGFFGAIGDGWAQAAAAGFD